MIEIPVNDLLITRPGTLPQRSHELDKLVVSPMIDSLKLMIIFLRAAFI
jgi:hypothetical protein